MKWLGILLAAGAVLAAAQAAFAMLLALMVAGLVYGLFAAPRETFGLIGLLALFGVMQVQPLAFLGVMALMVLAKIIMGRK